MSERERERERERESEREREGKRDKDREREIKELSSSNFSLKSLREQSCKTISLFQNFPQRTEPCQDTPPTGPGGTSDTTGEHREHREHRRTQGAQPQTNRLLGNEPQNLARALSLRFDVGGSRRRKWRLIGRCRPEVDQSGERSAERERG